MMLGAGGDKEVRGRYRDARIAAGTRQIDGNFPGSGRSGHLLEVPLELAQEALLASPVCSIPKLEQDEVTEHRASLYSRGADQGADLRITVPAQGFDPSRSVHQDAVDHGSSFLAHAPQLVLRKELVKRPELLGQALKALATVEIGQRGNHGLPLAASAGVLHGIAKLYLRNINRRLHAAYRTFPRNPRQALSESGTHSQKNPHRPGLPCHWYSTYLRITRPAPPSRSPEGLPSRNKQ